MSPVFSPPFGMIGGDSSHGNHPIPDAEDRGNPEGDEQHTVGRGQPSPLRARASMRDMHKYFTGSELDKAIRWYRRVSCVSGVAVIALVLVVIAMAVRLSMDSDRCATFAASERELIAAAISDPTRPNTWTTVVSVNVAPGERYFGAAAAVDGNVLYIYGGLFGSAAWGIPLSVLSDLWSFNEQTDSWTRIAPSGGGPSGRFLATLVPADARPTSAFHHLLLLFGGFQTTVGSGGAQADVWALDVGNGNHWNLLSPSTSSSPTPSARGGHSSVGLNGVLYIHGGTSSISSTMGFNDEVWSFRVATRVWTLLPARGGVATSAALHLVASSTLFVPIPTASSVPETVRLMEEGGSKVWTFDLSAGSWSSTTTAYVSTSNGLFMGAQVAAGGADADGMLFVFGGRLAASAGSVLLPSSLGEVEPTRDELAAFDATTHKWSPLYPNYNRTAGSSRPPPLDGQLMARVGSRILMFGGREHSTGHPGSSNLRKYQLVNPVN